MAELRLVKYAHGVCAVETSSGSVDFLTNMLTCYRRNTPGGRGWIFLDGWVKSDMPDEFVNLFCLCASDRQTRWDTEADVGLPWRQAIDWLLQHEDDVPPEFMRWVKFVVDGDQAN